MYVGYPTVEAIIGNRIAPGFADWYLVRNGYDAQQTIEPVEPDRRDNLWETVPGDWGAHGDFDDRAADFSPQLWASTHRGWLAVAGAVIGVGACLAWWRKKRGEK
jgi:hypothetical protein